MSLAAAGPAGIPCWDRLSVDARRALCEMAELFLLDEPLTAEISVGQGACRTFDVRFSRGAVKKLLDRSA